MKDLLEAFQIFNKYIPDTKYPTICEHDELIVLCDPEMVSDDDKAKLESLGFSEVSTHGDAYFRSFRFGSA